MAEKDMEKGDSNGRKRGRDEGRRSQRMGVIKRMKKRMYGLSRMWRMRGMGERKERKVGLSRRRRGGEVKGKSWIGKRRKREKWD